MKWFQYWDMWAKFLWNAKTQNAKPQVLTLDNLNETLIAL